MKKSFRFVLISILLHLSAFIVLMRIPFSLDKVDRHEKSLSINFFKFKSPKVTKPPEQEDKNLPTSVEKSKEPKPPSIPKPTILQNELAFQIDQIGSKFRSAEYKKKTRGDTMGRRSTGALEHWNVGEGVYEAKGQHLAIALDSKIDDQSRPEMIEATQIGEFDTPGELSEASPSINRNVSRRELRRGQGLLYYAYANSSSSTVSESEKTGEFYYMMLDLANNFAKRAERKIDVVFVLDTTGSMDDNIRGVRAYTGLFFGQLKLNSIDVAMGLVTFSDQRNRKPDVYGVTTKIEKIKQKLFDIEFTGGSELAESALDALVTAVNQIKFRRGASKFFVLISDGTFHDADFDGQSQYCLDGVLELLKQKKIIVDVVGLDYLPVKQLAYGTGGNWQAVPGKGLMENIYSSEHKNYSQLGTLTVSQGGLRDEVIVRIDPDNPSSWIRLTYKVLNPLGEKCFEDEIFVEHNSFGWGSRDFPLVERSSRSSKEKGDNQIKLYPNIDTEKICELPGTYTLIYRIENSKGERSLLRRVIDHRNKKR